MDEANDDASLLGYDVIYWSKDVSELENLAGWSCIVID